MKIEQITVKQLFESCKFQIKIGNGDKYIVVADDQEGNGYHGMYFLFSENTEDIKDLIHDADVSENGKIIILG